MTRALLLALALGGVTLAGQAPALRKVFVIPVRPKDLQICAEYISTAFPRDAQRACVDASEVARWMFLNGRPADECGE